MNTRQAGLPLPITLGSAPLQRLSQRLSDLLHDAQQRCRNAAQRRAERRLARARHALYASLDARTLRDIGLGEWAARTGDDEASIWRRTTF